MCAKAPNSASKLANVAFGVSGVKLQVPEHSYMNSHHWNNGVLDVERFGALSYKKLRCEWDR